MKVAIIQQLLPKYRIDVFQRFQELLKGRGDSLKLLSVEEPVGKINFEHLVFKAWRKHSIWLTEKMAPLLRDSHVIIILWDIHWVSLMALVFFKRKNQKIILWGHGVSNSDNRLAKIPRQITAHFANALIFYDPMRKNIFCGNNKKLLDKSFVAPNTVIVSNHGEGLAKDRKNFLYVGRINKYKQVDLLIEAYELYSKKSQSPRPLTIIGGGDLLDDLRNEVEKKKLNHLIQFTGPIYEDDALRPHFFSAICYINPGTVGLGVVHSFAFGTPALVCQDRKHGPEFSYCKKDNSIIYSGDASALAEKMLMVDTQPEHFNELGKNAYQYFIHELQASNMLAGIIDAVDFTSGHH